MFVFQQALNMQVKLENNDQRETTFNLRYLVNRRVCGVIIDGGNCTNVASTLLVHMVGLKCILHPSPSKLHWLDDNKEISVTNRYECHFMVGNMRMKYCVMLFLFKQDTYC